MANELALCQILGITITKNNGVFLLLHSLILNHFINLVINIKEILKFTNLALTHLYYR